MAILSDALNERQGVTTQPVSVPTAETAQAPEDYLDESGNPIPFDAGGVEPPRDASGSIIEPAGSPTIDPSGTTVQDLYGTGEAGLTPNAPGVETPTVGEPIGADVIGVDTAGGVGTVGTPGEADVGAGIEEGVGAIGDVGTGEQTALTQEQQVDAELARVLGQDSPLMAQARANAAQIANTRGLQNTSMAAGITQAEMVKAALPIAQQNASQALQREMANTEFRQQAGLFTAEQTARLRSLEAELGTNVSVFNAEQLNQAEQLSAQMKTAIAQQDAEAYNRASQQLADLQRQAQAQQADIEMAGAQQTAAEQQAYNQQIIDRVTRLNEQYLQGSQAMDLATIQGTFQQIISTNETAAGLYKSYLDGMAGIMDNPKMDANQIASAVGRMQQMLRSSLEMMTELNGLDIGVTQTGSPTTPPPTTTPIPGGGGAPFPSGPTEPIGPTNL